jgi:hypothetical protein
VVETEEGLDMAAKIKVISPDLSPSWIWDPGPVERLWFFPSGSEYLRYAPHFHVIHQGGLRQNLPLSHMFVVVYEGKLSVKNYSGETYIRIDVRNQIWFIRGSMVRAQEAYALTLGREPYGSRVRVRTG